MNYYKIVSRIAIKNKSGSYKTKTRTQWVKSELGSADVLLNIFGLDKISLPGQYESPDTLRFYHTQQSYIYITKTFGVCNHNYKEIK